jgi:cation diffusion facilitator family transporter
MDEQEISARSRAGWVALVAGVVILAGKFFAYGLTGSAAVLSDAMESVVNVVAGGLLLLSLGIAARPADTDHPYGHGKVEFFSAGIEGAMIFMAAVLIAVEAVQALVVGPELRRLDQGLAVLAVFSVANWALGIYLVRVGHRTRSAALVADGRHVLTDVWTTGGVLVGLGLVWVTGWTLLDPLMALAVAANILREGFRLVRDSVHGLMDKADEETLQGVTEALAARRGPEWIDIHGLRTWQAGAALHVDMHLQVPRYLSAEQLHDIHESIEEVLCELIGAGGGLVVHFDPCRPNACSRCEQPDCPVREAALVARPPLTLESATRMDPEVDHGPGLHHPWASRRSG